MVKAFMLATLGVYLSCVAVAAASGEANALNSLASAANEPSTRNLRTMAAAEVQGHEHSKSSERQKAAKRWTKIDNAKLSFMESKERPEALKYTTKVAMEARVKEMTAPHKSMPNVVMESRGTKKAGNEKNKVPRKKKGALMMAAQADRKYVSFKESKNQAMEAHSAKHKSAKTVGYTAP